MKHRRLVLLAISFFIVTLLCLTAPVGNRLACATWDELAGSATGGGVSNNTYSRHASLTLDSSDNPHIAWYDNPSGDYEVYYAYWDGSSWVTHGGANTGGGVSNNAGNSFTNWRPSLVLDNNDNPHIAWDDDSSGNFEIYYAYWNGTSWTTLGGANTSGGVSNNTGISGYPSLALDSFGNPHIAWEEDGPIPWPLPGNDEIYYAYWDGSNWVTHGGANTGGGVSNNAGRS